MRDPERAKEAQARYRAKNKEKQAARNKAFYDANRDREKERARQWRAENPDKLKAQQAAYRLANKEQRAAWTKAWREANQEHCATYRKMDHARTRGRANEMAREWKRQNPGRCNALVAQRIAAKKRATPAWADDGKIQAFYDEAARLTRETGVPHHVDHIYPLQSNWVCGLHVHNNLQILTGAENQAKSNRRVAGL